MSNSLYWRITSILIWFWIKSVNFQIVHLLKRDLGVWMRRETPHIVSSILAIHKVLRILAIHSLKKRKYSSVRKPSDNRTINEKSKSLDGKKVFLIIILIEAMDTKRLQQLLSRKRKKSFAIVRRSLNWNMKDWKREENKRRKINGLNDK